ncbi:hypothetical protein [Nocardia australiensis]|uniref:hypothetical protein n=1 Tax=Nocardia australiensis TaxID=2887191 RepID=UPI001D134928|nr:hypothetical protein [Nocardia australiensis]
MVDLSARPDVQDLLGTVTTTSPTADIDIDIDWSAVTAGGGLVRLTIEWKRPTHVDLAIVFEADHHAEILQALATGDYFTLTGTNPEDGSLGIAVATVPARGELLARTWIFTAL